MSRSSTFRLAILALLMLALVVPSAYAITGNKSAGLTSVVTPDNLYQGDTSYFVRWQTEWKVDAKKDTGYLNCNLYNWQDEPGTPILNTLFKSWSYPVSDVVKTAPDTIEFYSPGWVFDESESHYYSTGQYRIVDEGATDHLHWFCDVCQVYHGMSAQPTSKHVKLTQTAAKAREFR